jgi:hypothetical protein
VWTTTVSAQQKPIAQQIPVEDPMIRRDLVQASARVETFPGFEWSFWPYLGLIIVSAVAFEVIRQRRRENEWRRLPHNDEVTPGPVWPNTAARH